jgi:hypothetical protein
MRQEDKDEIWHLDRRLPLEALRDALAVCEFNRAVLLDGKVVFIYGVAGTKGGAGVPWLLASDLLKEVTKPFIKNSKGYLEELFRGYTALYNVAWSKNVVHIRWLEWLGFEIMPAVPMGPDGELYHKFIKVN